MSTPLNPLSNFSNYQVKHVLAAFKSTSDAETTELNKNSGTIGERVKGADGVIVINEFSDSRFLLKSLLTSWTKSGPNGPLTTGMYGTITLTDATGGYFMDRFIREVTDELDMSAQQLTFSLKTYFMGQDKTVKLGGKEFDVIYGPQLIFHVHEFKDIINSTSTGTSVELGITAAYNTTAQSPSLAKPYQMTLTHVDGNLSNSGPKVFAESSKIEPRGVEDSTKSEPRSTRIDQSKPMRTLKDIFDAFGAELNQQRFVHNAQVQDWLDIIRNDYVRKINKPNSPRGDLPIKFKVELDPEYHSYAVDNRNLPYEQIEEDFTSSGVSSITMRPGNTITSMVSQLMKYSSAVGTDASVPMGSTFKVNSSYIQDGGQITVNIKIKKIVIPHNTMKFGDSGPGEGGYRPLEFTFKSGETDDLDILYMRTDLATDSGVIPLEYGERVAVYGNREPIMGDRIPITAPGTEYFKSEYSGLRVPIFHNFTAGLENHVDGANAELSYTVTNRQSSTHEIQIYGNPHLMFDLHRLPSEASGLNSPGNYNYYMMPESHPMYIKIDIYLRPDAVIGNEPLRGVNELYYYTNYYEVTGVVNNLTNGGFLQHLLLKKTDNIV